MRARVRRRESPNAPTAGLLSIPGVAESYSCVEEGTTLRVPATGAIGSLSRLEPTAT
jgi:hypothetical protein